MPLVGDRRPHRGRRAADPRHGLPHGAHMVKEAHLDVKQAEQVVVWEATIG
jgi:hypothetical protein